MARAQPFYCRTRILLLAQGQFAVSLVLLIVRPAPLFATRTWSHSQATVTLAKTIRFSEGQSIQRSWQYVGTVLTRNRHSEWKFCVSSRFTVRPYGYRVVRFGLCVTQGFISNCPAKGLSELRPGHSIGMASTELASQIL
jgi:hypothetical protein